MACPLDCRAKVHRLPGRAAAREASNFLQGGMVTSAPREGVPRTLDTFFPFDPYLLRSSSAALDLPRTYIRWQPREDDDEDEHDETTRSTPSAPSAFGDRTVCSIPDGSYLEDGFLRSSRGHNSRGSSGFAGAAGFTPIFGGVQAMSFEEQHTLR